MKLTVLAVTLAAAGWLTACNNTQKETNSEAHNHEHANSNAPAPTAANTVTATFKNVDPAVAKHLNALLVGYLRIKNALVEDNAPQANSAAKELQAAVADLDRSLLTAEQLKVYSAHINGIKENADHIATNNELAHQREHLAALTQDTYELIKAFGTASPVYYTHCPMAFDNKGAMWLSEEAEIRNPYYGEQMLSCGEVKETIQ